MILCTRILTCLMATLLSSTVLARSPVVPATEHINPEAATGFQQHDLAYAQYHMVSAANPIAAQAGADILAAGGSAADAAIATQLVLNVVEPQSSGIGGGGFLVNYDAESGKVQAFDGRETAPAAVRSGLFSDIDSIDTFWAAVNSGSSVGTPGLVRMLAGLHKQQGRLP